MKTQEKALLVSTLVLGVVVAGAALARPSGDGVDEKRARRFVGHVVEDALDDLDATDAQRAAVNEIVERAVTDLLPLMAEKKAARGDVVTLLRAPTIAPDDVHGRVDARTKLMSEGLHRAADAFIEIHAVLTPAQRQELAARIEAHEGRRHGFWHR